MSRSRKKNPFHGITSLKSEKEDKRNANRAERRVNNQILQSTGDGDSLKVTNEVSNVATMDKDGKFRFDPKEFPKLVRK